MLSTELLFLERTVEMGTTASVEQRKDCKFLVSTKSVTTASTIVAHKPSEEVPCAMPSEMTVGSLKLSDKEKPCEFRELTLPATKRRTVRKHPRHKAQCAWSIVKQQSGYSKQPKNK